MAQQLISSDTVQALAVAEPQKTAFRKIDENFTELYGSGAGTVTSVSVTTVNGVSGSVATPTTTPAISLTLGAITPSSVAATGTVAGSNLSGTNTGDQTITLTGDVTGSGVGSFAATIANDAVTYAKIQNVTADRLLGRATAGAGDTEEIVLGTNLSFTGTTLNAASAAGANPTATVGLSAVNGVATTFLRSDGAPALSQSIVPTWTGAHTFNGAVTLNAAGNNVTGTISFSDSVALSSVLLLDTANSPAALPSGSTNDYNPGSGLGSRNMFRLTPDAAGSTVTGFVAQAQGYVFFANNIQTGATGTLTLAHQNAGSSATNRIICPGETNLVIPAGGGVFLRYDNTTQRWRVISIATNDVGGTVTTVSVVTANGVSGSVATPTTTPAITLTLGAITPSSVAATGTVTGSNLSGTNTGDQTITLTGDVTGTGTGSFAATIANDAVTYAKIQNVTTNRLLGRATAGSGDTEEIVLGTNLSFTGTTLNAASGASVAGSDTQVQFNDGGAFGADADFTWNKTTHVLKLGSTAVPGVVTGHDATSAVGGAITLEGGIGNGAGNAGGTVDVIGGSASDGNGGGAGVTGANGVGTNRLGGYAILTAGNSNGTGAGALAQVVGGNNIGGAGAGGGVTIAGGFSTSTGAGGTVTLQGGDGGSTSGNGGNVVLDPGTQTGSQVSGSVISTKWSADQSYSLQTPSTGFSITIGDGVGTLVLNPAGTLATGTITMPASPINGQEIRFSSSQIVTTLTVSANAGQTISNAPATIVAGQGFAYIYNTSGTNWFRLY